MSTLSSFLAAYSRTGLRGSYRLTRLFAKWFPSLHRVVVDAEGGEVVIDLRIGTARALLANPRSTSGESAVMLQFISEGDVVYDIGAHFGIYTVLMSSIVGASGRVIAFEPNPQMLPCLRQTVSLKSNVQLVDSGLSDAEGEFDLFVPEDASMTSLSDWTHGIGGKVHKSKCTVATLDGLIGNGTIPPPAFIKCDVEGAELKLFKGGLNLLDRPDAPVILFELNNLAANEFGYSTMECLDLLSALPGPNYDFFEVKPDGLTNLPEDPIEYANVIAIPLFRRERLEL